ncbi:rRNA processing and telomere maintaining methyltransferase, putative [Plasmodium gallinaceum]|uniref:Ribosomal RNA-processing protein 8 n=1 Tax=Plasmodium gallinaceum TaxID=5849 RepID=A0A1J1GWE9_PLAGA|nr:rRNA processing and telomere maintaining methyltransferase, putative [Plasmodium gallinaceum]CRG96799.1 rRNA processing and telomere maintaining methyltransferase, putative [Plasmodium gallinaceum]
MEDKNIKVKLKNKQNNNSLKKKENKNNLYNTVMKQSKKKISKIIKKKKRFYNKFKIENTNSCVHNKISKNEKAINDNLINKNPKNGIIKDISKKKKSTKSHSNTENKSKEIKHPDMNKRKNIIYKNLIKNNEKVSKSTKIKKEENKKFPNINTLYKDTVNKNFYYHMNKKNEDPCSSSNLEKNKQKYKKKKKIDRNPEDIVNSSLFRYINEYMYTNKSIVVEKKLNETKNIFNIYHLGYKNQKEKWPNNPVNVIINYLKKNFTKHNNIGDLGCGEAEIAKTLNDWLIDSFDLIKFNEYVTACNITKLEKPDDSYDCLILSLSLMNTDWPKIIFESVRCLKKKGTLIIAEVVSRFKNYKAFMKFMNNVGFKLSKKVNLDDFFFVFFFENNKKDNSTYILSEKRVKKVSELLTPCIYKRR